jgi:hypothetical protein
MKSSIKARCQWLAVWAALLGGCYWAGARVAIGAPPPACTVTCKCVLGIGYNSYDALGVFVDTTYYYVAPPLGAQNFLQAAVTNVQYNGKCDGNSIGVGLNQMYVTSTTTQFPDSCTPITPPATTDVALQPTLWTFPPKNPPANAATFCE